MLLTRRPRWGLGMNSNPAAKKASGNHSGVVDDEQFVAAQQGRKIREEPVVEGGFPAVKEEETRRVAALERPLGNLGVGQEVIELFEAHQEKV